jgi:mono/diheme cytochrome c family protein
MNTVRKVLVGVAGLVPAAFLVIQLFPYGRAHTNPPVVQEPVWDSPETRALAERACFDCHSNETVWPWYSNVAPLSWMVQDHVDEGREVLNFSEWNRPYDEAHEAGEEVGEGEMPMPGYVWLHPEANLTDAERDALIRGLDATLGGEGGEEGGGEGGHGGEGDDDDGDHD